MWSIKRSLGENAKNEEWPTLQVLLAGERVVIYRASILDTIGFAFLAARCDGLRASDLHSELVFACLDEG